MYKCNSVEEGQKALNDLINYAKNSDCPYGLEISKAMINWYIEISNCFDFRVTNSFTDGLNNKLELINRSGFDYRNKNFYLRRAFLPIK